MKNREIRTKEKPKDQYNVLIVAPYKPHIELIKKLIKDEFENRLIGEDESKKYNYIKAGTVHSFQGEEADIVIFDLVVDAPHRRANLFNNFADSNEELKKMFNVAITRAKYQLFIVGNFSFCMKYAQNNALSDLLSYLTKKYKPIDAVTVQSRRE